MNKLIALLEAYDDHLAALLEHLLYECPAGARDDALVDSLLAERHAVLDARDALRQLLN